MPVIHDPVLVVITEPAFVAAFCPGLMSGKSAHCSLGLGGGW